MCDNGKSAAGISSPRLHGSALSPDQIIEWCKAWWESDEWRKTQQRVYACDVAHLLRGVADMIEDVPNKILANVKGEKCHDELPSKR